MSRCSISAYSSRNAITNIMRYFFVFKPIGLAKIIKIKEKGTFSIMKACEPNKWVLYFSRITLKSGLLEEM